MFVDFLLNKKEIYTMLKNEKLSTTLTFLVILILLLDILFVHFNNHMWPIFNIECFEIYAFPLALIPCFTCHNFPNIRNNKYLLFLAYIWLALIFFGLIFK